MLTKKDKEDIKDIVVDVIEDVIMPSFELVATKTDLKMVEKRLDEVENRLESRLDRLDHKLDIFSDKVIVQGSELADCKNRIKRLENSRLAV